MACQVFPFVMTTDWHESEAQPYICHRASQPIIIDGDLSKPAWRNATKSPRFVDMISGAPGMFNTQMAALWDDTNLYVAFWVEEPFVEAHLTERDSTIFQENDVEVFIDGGDCYDEFEINALNTVYEVFFVWQDAYRQKFNTPAYDVHARQAFTFGGNHDRDAKTFWRGTHPRGLRWAFTDWDFAGLQTAVKIDGTLNDHRDIDRGWTVEIAFPWAGMAELAHGRSVPPQAGDEWRIFFGRFGRVDVAGRPVSTSMSFGRVGDTDNHLPERFARVTFAA